MASHSTCTHPSTPAARAQCRKQRAAGIAPAPLLVTAPKLDLTPGLHMTEAQARKVANDLLAAHGLHSWTVRFDNAKRRAGQCRYGDRVLSLSRPLMALRTYAETHNTITHELAHALTPGHKHDGVWAAKHRELGGDGKRCFDTTDEVADLAPWIGTCEHGKQFPKYRQPKRLEGWRCKCPEGKSTVTWARNP